MSDQIYNQLKDLKNIKPNKTWRNNQRDILISQISQQSKEKENSLLQNSWFLCKSMLPSSMLRFVARPVGVLTLIVFFAFSSGVFGISASKTSIPGDILYPVKLTGEKIKVGLTVSSEKKAELHVQFAEERMNEIETVLVQETEPAKKQAKVKIAVDEMKKDIQKATETIDKVKEIPKKSQSVAETVKEIDKKSEGITEKIEQKKKELKEDKELSKTLTEAEEATEEISVVAVAVLVEKHEKGEIELSETELVEVVGEKIQKAKENIEELTAGVENITKGAEDVEALDDEGGESELSEEEVVDSASKTEETQNQSQNSNSGQAEETQNQSQGSDSGQAEETETAETEQSEAVSELESVKLKPSEAEAIIADALDLLGQGDLTSALEKVTESAVLVKEANKTVDKIVSEQEYILNKPRIFSDEEEATSELDESGEYGENQEEQVEGETEVEDVESKTEEEIMDN